MYKIEKIDLVRHIEPSMASTLETKEYNELHNFYHNVARDEMVLLIRSYLIPKVIDYDDIPLTIESRDYSTNCYNADLLFAIKQHRKMNEAVSDQDSYEFEQSFIKYMETVELLKRQEAELEDEKDRYEMLMCPY